jgi:hypothetical protein
MCDPGGLGGEDTLQPAPSAARSTSMSQYSIVPEPDCLRLEASKRTNWPSFEKSRKSAYCRRAIPLAARSSVVLMRKGAIVYRRRSSRDVVAYRPFATEGCGERVAIGRQCDAAPRWLLRQETLRQCRSVCTKRSLLTAVDEKRRSAILGVARFVEDPRPRTAEMTCWRSVGARNSLLSLACVSRSSRCLAPAAIVRPDRSGLPVSGTRTVVEERCCRACDRFCVQDEGAADFGGAAEEGRRAGGE